MKKFLMPIFIIIIAILLFFYFSNSNKNKNNTNNTNNTNSNTTNNVTSELEQNNLNISRISSEENKISNTNISHSDNPVKEEEISNYSTKIHTKDSNRQNNLSITCSKLNNHIVKASETFSFTSTIGPSTSEKGYQEADIFDSNGNKKKGLGGGNCQISSTLYNAVLNISGLSVVERHEHSNKVPYVPAGKDAAVAYGSVDLKFKNNNNFDIKILATTDSEYVYIKIFKIQ